MTKANISEYEELEQRLIEKDAQFREYFTTTGVIGDQKIKDPTKRESQQTKRRRLYQNTQVLMENYQTIVWVVQNFPDTIAEELNEPFRPDDYPDMPGRSWPELVRFLFLHPVWREGQ